MATEIDRLMELLDAQELRIRRAFLDFITTARSDQLIGQVADLLAAGDVEGALKIIDTYVARFANVIPQVQSTVGAATAAEFQAALPTVIAAIVFDPTFPRAAEIAASSRMDLIREVAAEQRLATAQAVSRAVNAGEGPVATARAFRDSIGLTASQEAYVASYRSQLENLDRRALERELRDRRFDARLENAAQRGRPLTQNQINTMVDRYRARAIQSRAETISRTEALRAYSQAREESLQQMLEQTGIDPRRVDRVWHAVHDNRVREWHLVMEGQRRPMGGRFRDGLGNWLLYPGDPGAPAETTINCRCTLTFSIRPTAA